MASASMVLLLSLSLHEADVAEHLQPGGMIRVGVHPLQRLNQRAKDHRGFVRRRARLDDQGAELDLAVSVTFSRGVLVIRCLAASPSYLLIDLGQC